MKPVVPFLKWAGGKRWFVKDHLDAIPAYTGRYFEPFLGSGTVFFALRPSRAILSDLNEDLVATFSAIKQNWSGVQALLRRYQRLHSKRFYYKMRESRPTSPAARAARLIYLNRTCWNGLYRVNAHGEFNVPKGTKENVILATDDFQQISLALQSASLIVSDFKRVIRRARQDDLIFADPPYVTSHSNNGFLKYNEQLFSWNDQIRLRDCLIEAKNKGAHVVATNADTPPIRTLYKEGFTIQTVTRPSVIAAGPDRRRTVTELIITSWQ
jgi:DNA adenine methylase